MKRKKLLIIGTLALLLLISLAVSQRFVIISHESALSVSRHGPPPKNQIQNLPSPSGKYVLSVTIEKNTTNTTYSGTPVWKVTIQTLEGERQYKDEDSTMVGTISVYWGWDSQDNVWVYNSDDGTIWKWSKGPMGWEKHLVEGEDKKNIPEQILPEYARSE